MSDTTHIDPLTPVEPSQERVRAEMERLSGS